MIFWDQFSEASQDVDIQNVILRTTKSISRAPTFLVEAAGLVQYARRLAVSAYDSDGVWKEVNCMVDESFASGLTQTQVSRRYELTRKSGIEKHHES